MAFGWGIPMAYAAVTDSLPLAAWLLLLGNVLWSTIYDTQYAMVDREDDLRSASNPPPSYSASGTNGSSVICNWRY